MKRIILLAVLALQLVAVRATVVTAQISPSFRQIEQKLFAGSLMEILHVDVKGTGRQSIPQVSLAVRVTGLATFGGEPVFTAVYLGTPERQISYGPFPIGNSGQVLVGPIHLHTDEWKTVVITALIANDLSASGGREAGLAVDAVVVDGYHVAVDDTVTYEGSFPIRSLQHLVMGNVLETSTLFTRDLCVGMTGPDVLRLQQILNTSPDTRLAETGPGSPGNETSYFDELTRVAVMKFQTQYGIAPASGYVGPITRALLNGRDDELWRVSIESIQIQDIPNTTLRGVGLHGVVQPNTVYNVEATADFLTWKVVGETSPRDTVVLKEAHCAVFDTREFPRMIFFRLAEKP